MRSRHVAPHSGLRHCNPPSPSHARARHRSSDGSHAQAGRGPGRAGGSGRRRVTVPVYISRCRGTGNGNQARKQSLTATQVQPVRVPNSARVSMPPWAIKTRDRRPGPGPGAGCPTAVRYLGLGCRLGCNSNVRVGPSPFSPLSSVPGRCLGRPPTVTRHDIIIASPAVNRRTTRRSPPALPAGIAGPVKPGVDDATPAVTTTGQGGIMPPSSGGGRGARAGQSRL